MTGYPYGTMVRIKGRKGVAALARVVRWDGDAVDLQSESSGIGIAVSDDVEVIDRQPDGWVPLRHMLPYGVWTCPDGRQVLFNRDYTPIWQKDANGKVSVADQTEWVEFDRQDHFYVEGSEPWMNKETLQRCSDVLMSFANVDVTKDFKVVYSIPGRSHIARLRNQSAPASA